VESVASAQVVRVRSRGEALQRELTDRLQHQEARSLDPDQATLDQRLQGIEVGLTHGLGGL
jgi:hypothetical protein